MAEEKRVKLGVDLGELSNQLLQINTLVEQNYQVATQGQAEYNKILEESIDLLEQQAELIKSMGGGANKSIPNTPVQMGGGNSSSQMSESEIRKYILLIDRIRGTMNGSQDNRQDEVNDNLTEDKENNLLERILDECSSILENVQLIAEGTKNEQNKPSSENEESSEEGEGENGESGQNGKSGKAGKGGGKNQAANAFNQGAAVVSKDDPTMAVVGLLAMIPYIGQGLSSFISSTIQASENRAEGLAHIRNASGGHLGASAGYGYTTAEMAEKLAGMYSSNVHLRQSDVGFEKAMNISGLTSALRTLRHDEFASNSSSIKGFLGTLAKTNIGYREARGYADDYLKILVDINNQQLEVSGKTNAALTSQVVGGIANLSKDFKDPTTLARITSSIQNSLSKAPNAQLEALQFYALQKAKPGASLLDMEEIKENPFAHPDYIKQYIKAIKEIGGSEEDQIRNIREALGVSTSQARRIYKGNFRLSSKGIMNPSPAVPAYQNQIVAMKELKADIGDQLIGPALSASNTVLELTGELAKYIPTIVDTAKRFIDDPFGTIGGALVNAGGAIMDTATEWIEELSESISNKLKSWLDPSNWPIFGGNNSHEGDSSHNIITPAQQLSVPYYNLPTEDNDMAQVFYGGIKQNDIRVNNGIIPGNRT